MTPDTPDAITRLYRACEPNEALAADDPRFVILDDVRGETPSRQYERSLRLSDSTRPEVKVFAGHIGVGKSSELRRLQHRLENPETGRPYKVILAETGKALDLNDLDFPDLLVFLAAEVQRNLQALKIPGFTGTTEYLYRVWDEVKAALQSNVSFSEVEIDVPFGSLTAELRNRPSSRALLRAEIEKQSTSLQNAVNDLLELARVKLWEAGWEGLVLIVDDLEKMPDRSLDSGVTTHERLFIHRSEQLANLNAHVIYSVPITLIYSPQFAGVEQAFGGRPIPVPMIRLRGDHRSPVTPNTAGMKKMREIIDKRCQFAKVDFAEVFDSAETCHLLCEMTGGHPRHLMMFLRSALTRVEGLPITRAAADGAIREAANSLVRQIDQDEWPRLRSFLEPSGEIRHDPEHLQMLRLLHVFEYMNGEPWYEVNPVVRTLPRLYAAD